MAVSPEGGSTGSGSAPGSGPATASPAAPSGQSSTSGGPLGPVDTHVIDVASDRYHQVGEQIKALASRAAALANYSPTFSGAPDSSWNAFISKGYNGAASGTSDALHGAAQAVTALASTSKQLSTLFTRTEQQNVDIAGQLARALDGGDESGSSSSSGLSPSSRTDVAGSMPSDAALSTKVNGPVVAKSVRLAGVRPDPGQAPTDSAEESAGSGSVPTILSQQPDVSGPTAIRGVLAPGVPRAKETTPGIGTKVNEPVVAKSVRLAGVRPDPGQAPTDSAEESAGSGSVPTISSQQPDVSGPEPIRGVLAPGVPRAKETTPGTGGS